MPSKHARRRIALDAARLLYDRQETEVHAARDRAAVMNGVDPRRRRRDLPSSREIRTCVDEITFEREGDAQPANDRERHLATLKMMWRLAEFDPRYLPDESSAASADAPPGPATGEVKSTPILIALRRGTSEAVEDVLNRERFPYVVETGDAAAGGSDPHLRLRFHLRSARGDVLEFLLFVGGDGPSRAIMLTAVRNELTTPELETWIQAKYPDADLEALRDGEETWADPYVVFTLLLQRLDGVKQKPEHHPEGDALYHSLQAFDLAREQVPYDEEFLQAALLHDVGKGIDPIRHIDAGLAALAGLISPRTKFLIEFHSAARHLRDGRLTGRLRQELLDHDWRDDLMSLLEIDDGARKVGVETSTVPEAVAYLRSLASW